MGADLCALPTGEHCARGLVCLGRGHAQPKQSAAPVFRSMLSSERRALTAARDSGEPAGRLAARELEIGRIQSALRRADELTADVADAIEAAARARRRANRAAITALPIVFAYVYTAVDHAITCRLPDFLSGGPDDDSR